MNKEQDYASDSDASDEDFRPDDLAGESPVSEEDAEDSEENEEFDEHTEVKKKPAKRKALNKKVSRKKTKSNQDAESEDENTNTSRRSTRQKDNAKTNGKGQSLEKDELLSDEEDKSRNNALWANFLNDVKPSESLSTVSTSVFENKPSSSGQNGKDSSKKLNNQEPKAKTTLKVEEKKRVVTEVLDFAGEEVSIEREIDASSIKENKAATIPAAKKQPFSRIMPGGGIKRTIPTAASGSGAGLGSLLNQLGKKKKLSVLEKSQLDWKSFKQNEGIDEQLQTFNKGKDGYLERQDFLQRTDLRQFEIEKNLRQSNRRPF